MIIALDSASPDQSVALADASGALVADASWSVDRGQGSQLLPRLLRLLDDHHRSLADVTGVAVGLGPGSFTGLRVGLAVAKGLAVGLTLPIVGVPSLDAWLTAEPAASAALVRAGAAEAWARSRDEREPRLLAFETLADAARHTPVVAPRELITALGLARATPPDGAAAAVARLAAERFDRATPDDLARLEPVYLRPPRGLPDAAEVPITWL